MFHAVGYFFKSIDLQLYLTLSYVKQLNGASLIFDRDFYLYKIPTLMTR